jgi:hypothetical protein
MLFLADWVPRKVALDAEQRAGLPETLRRWLRFAFERRVWHRSGSSPWSLTDREAVDDAIRALNAEQLARRLIQE